MSSLSFKVNIETWMVRIASLALFSGIVVALLLFLQMSDVIFLLRLGEFFSCFCCLVVIMALKWYRQTCLSPPVIFLLPRWCFFCGLCFVSYCRVCSLHPCGHLLLVKAWPLGSLVCDVFLSLSHIMSQVRCGIWLYEFLIFAFFFTLVVLFCLCVSSCFCGLAVISALLWA